MRERQTKTRIRSVLFTLIELLVVVAIIAILTSLLLPAVGKAKSKVREVDCLSQLKGLYTASLNYSGDYNDFTPPNATLSVSGCYWQQLIVSLDYVQVPASSKGLTEGGPAGLFLCSAETRKEVGGKSEWNSWKGSHYGHNTYLNWQMGADDPTHWSQFTRVPKPSEVSFLGDKEGSNNRPETYGYSDDALALFNDKFRHSGNMSVLFAEGHGESRKAAAVPNSNTDSTPYKRVFWGRKDCYGISGGW
jgi:prepilin-type N-terminal cleavage/methylation domain-containing protein